MSNITNSIIEGYQKFVEEDKAFKWNNIILFSWKEWDQLDTDTLIFYNCTSPDGRIHKYLAEYYQGHPEIKVNLRSMDISVRLDGWIQINALGPRTKDSMGFENIETYTLYEGWIIDWDYARKKMLKHIETYKECKV